MRAALLALALLLAGCLGAQTPPPPAGPGTPSPPVGAGPAGMTFSAPMLIDDVRAGGEPVIAITHNGVIIVSAHPGYTHLHNPGDPTDLPDEALLPTTGQSYLWRSLDQGKTWQTIGTPNAPMGDGPRGTEPGVSDPDMTVTSSNRVYHTDLEALASASVGWSDDDGATWLMGNPVASGGAVDRQWLASIDDTVYFTANYFSDHRVLRSTDGVTWQRLGDTQCGGDFVGAPDGTLYAACGAGVSTSEDGGMTFEVRAIPDHDGGGITEPAVDGAGNVWVAWLEGRNALWAAGSPDKGKTWPWQHNLTGAVHDVVAPNETEPPMLVFPWVSAGSAGRIAVSTFAGAGSEASADTQNWSVVSVAVFGADTNASAAQGYMIYPGDHLGLICRGGTGCQVGSMQGDAASDRRLGDFFETTIDKDGFLHLTFANTSVHPADWISHPAYVRQVDGPRFLADGDTFEPLQG